MTLSIIINWVSGFLQLAVAFYTLRLNRIFGVHRVGWSLFSSFGFLALLRLLEASGQFSFDSSYVSKVEIIYTLVSLLLLIGVVHIEALLKERLHVEQEAKKLRSELELRVREKNADLLKANEELREQIARREQKEKALQDSELQLRQAQKMEAIGQLAGGVAHDFNNIITVIAGYSNLLLQQTTDPQTADQLNQIYAAANRAASLTRQLLAFSRRHLMQSESLSLNVIIENITKMLRRLIGEDIVLQTIYGSNLPCVLADAGMVEQVIMNLVVNARDAMPKGGELTISTSGCQVDEAHVQKHQESRVGEFVCLRVRDTGCGMSTEVLGHLFEPFFTTKDVGKGTGLGLATVYGVVNQHSGWVEVATELGVGTEFTVYFPVAKKVASRNEPECDSPVTREAKETILLVEDEAPVRGLARLILSTNGYQVIEADCGASALALWPQYAERIDLVMTDVVMPGGISGRDLAERLRATKPDLKVVYTSGYSPSRAGQDPKVLEGLKFIPKPYNPNKLVRTIEDCLANRS